MGTLLFGLFLLGLSFGILVVFGKWAEFKQQQKAVQICDEHERRIDYIYTQEFARAYAEEAARADVEQQRQQMALQHYLQQQPLQQGRLIPPRVVDGYVVSDG